MSFSKPAFEKFNFQNCPLELPEGLLSIYALNKLDTYEIVDPNLIDAFFTAGAFVIFKDHARYKNVALTYENEMQQMAAYMKTYNRKTKRFMTKHYAEVFGREISWKSLSLSVFHRTTRHRLCDGVYKDFDLRNCHMRIALAYCKYYNIAHDAIEAYCNDEKLLRNELMDLHFPLTPDNETDDEYLKDRKKAAKQLPISVLNGGTYASWKKDFKVRDRHWNQTVLEIQRELIPLTDRIYAANQKIKTFCIQKNPDYKRETDMSKVVKFPQNYDAENRDIHAMKRSVVAKWFHTMERTVQEYAICCLCAHPSFTGSIESIDPCQDGLMCLIVHCFEGLIEYLNERTNAYFPFDQEWLEKDFDEAADFHAAETDQENYPEFIDGLVNAFPSCTQEAAELFYGTLVQYDVAECKRIRLIHQFVSSNLSQQIIHDIRTTFVREQGRDYFAELKVCLKQTNVILYARFKEEFESTYDIAINDDAAACNIMIDVYGHLFKRVCNNNGYELYSKSGLVWLIGKELFEASFTNLIKAMDITMLSIRQSKSGPVETRSPYSKCANRIKNCYALFKTSNELVTSNFEDLMYQSAHRRLPFQNGVFDFNEKKLIPHDQMQDKVFPFMIDRDYEETVPQEDIDELMDRVITPIFPDPDQRDYFLHVVARALACEVPDKKWYMMEGFRDSGKGTLTDMIRSAFGKFMGTFNADQFRGKASDDPGLMIKFIMPIRFSRINIANEANTDVVYSGTLLKMCCSGGDEIQARLNHGNEISFRPHGMFFFMTNKAPPVDKPDTFKNCQSFQFKNVFKSQYDLDHEYKFSKNAKLEDPGIKALVAQPRMVRAFTHIILNAYNITRQGLPDSMRVDHQLFLDEAKGQRDPETTIPEFVHYSHNPNDKVHSCDILDFLKINAQIECTARELHRVMRANNIGVYVDSFRQNGKQTSGYKHIKLIAPEKPTEVDDVLEPYDELTPMPGQTRLSSFMTMTPDCRETVYIDESMEESPKRQRMCDINSDDEESGREDDDY